MAIEEKLVGTVSEFAEQGGFRLIEVGGREIGVIKIGDTFHAIENRCPHQGGPICLGQVVPRVEAIVGGDGSVLEERFSGEAMHFVCPWHGFEFDVETGRCVADERYALRRYEVFVRGEEIYVKS